MKMGTEISNGLGSVNFFERFFGASGIKQKSPKGFTLIELLVVVAIMGILLSLGMVSWRELQLRSYDNRRVADIQAMQKALAMYQIQHASYPVQPEAIQITGSDAVSAALIGENLLKPGLRDPVNAPKNGVNYIYTYESDDGATFLIEYCLETDSIQGKVQGCGNTATP